MQHASSSSRLLVLWPQTHGAARFSTLLPLLHGLAVLGTQGLQPMDPALQSCWQRCTLMLATSPCNLLLLLLLQVSNERYKRHTFDGDGMVLSFSFDQGRVWFKNKFVRTKGFVDEQVGHRVAALCLTMIVQLQRLSQGADLWTLVVGFL
jgi:hypothetical protein